MHRNLQVRRHLGVLRGFQVKKFNITINGTPCIVRAGQTILEVAEEHGIHIPNLCHNNELEHYGGCSLCLVEIEGRPKLMRACATEPGPDWSILTESERVIAARKINMELQMSDHVGDCRGPCVLHCPDHVNIQDYVQAIADGDYFKAVEIIKQRLPMPASIGRICPHPCEQGCRRNLVDEAVSIADLKYFAADRVLKQGGFLPRKEVSTGKKVAIVGGGPAGLTAAFYLSLLGHACTIFDKMPQMGGMLRYGIPEYRLPKKVLDKEIAEIASLGVEMVNNVRIGKRGKGNPTLASLKREYDAVIMAVGAWKSSPMRCKGEEVDGVIGGIDFLLDVALGKPTSIGKKVAIVGGGNTAMDACRTAVRLGANKVYVVYRRTEAEMPADREEIAEAREEGVVYKFLRNPAEIISTDGYVTSMKLQVMELGEPDESGRRRPVPVEGKFEEIEVDTVISAIGQKLDAEGLTGITLTKGGTIEADPATFLTSQKGVFAVGDATNGGAGIAIEAIAEARNCVDIVDAYLRGESLEFHEPYFSETEKTPEDFADEKRIPRVQMAVIAPDKRKKDFSEVAKGYTEGQARKEAGRCMDCGCFDYDECRLIKNANRYEIDPSRLSGRQHHAYQEQDLVVINRDQGKCILCGQCVRTCSEIVGARVIGFEGRGFDATIAPAFVDSESALRMCAVCKVCVDFCPTGALEVISKGLRPKVAAR